MAGGGLTAIDFAQSFAMFSLWPRMWKVSITVHFRRPIPPIDQQAVTNLRKGRLRISERASGLGLSPQLSFGRVFNRRPLAKLIEKHRSNAPSDRRDIGSDSDWPANPFEIEPEYNGDQAIDNRIPPSCPRPLTHASPPPAHRRAGWPRPAPCANTPPGGKKYP